MKAILLFVYPILVVWMLFLSSGGENSQAKAQGRNVSAPPPKVLRYADIVIRRYDQNGDGILQQTEWEKMPGTPRAIDIDGTGLLSKDKLVWHIAQFGQTRTIHRVVTLDLSEPYRVDLTNLRLFRPVWQRTVPQVPQDEPAYDRTVDDVEETTRTHEQPIDEDAFPELQEERP